MNAWLAVAVVSVVAVAASPALAQDAAGDDRGWQGFYGGLAIGGAFSKAEPDTRALEGAYFNTNAGGSDAAQLDPILQRELEGGGVTGSAVVGYDVQSGNVVFGLEGDVTWLGFSESERNGPTTYDTFAAASFVTETTLETDFLFSLRPKLGYVFGDYLLHVSAGPSLGRFETTHRYTDTFGAGNSMTYSDTKTAFGLSSSVGAGVRVGKRWVLRGDYVFSYFPDVLDGRSELNGDGEADFDYDSNFVSHNLRLALILQF